MPPDAASTGTPCPICRKPGATRFTPFCSARCAEIDLGRWFGESYRVAATRPDFDEEDSFPETDMPG